MNHHWVLTGGEPLLQEKNLLEVIKKIPKKPFIEWETNGTIMPSQEIDKVSDQYNVSLKLSNSLGHRNFNTKNRRLKDEVISFFAKNPKANFKFVINRLKTIAEVKTLQKKFKIRNEKIWLMPEGVTKNDILKTSRWLIEYCLLQGYNFSPRLHIIMYGNKRKI